MEFEKSQNILDVRCVPDDVAFDNEPKDHCGQLPSEIEFNLDAVQQSALAHSKVKLSWDEDDIEERLVLKKRKFTDDELERIDYSNYLASDDSSESEDDEDSHQKKQELFRGLVEECEEEVGSFYSFPLVRISDLLKDLHCASRLSIGSG